MEVLAVQVDQIGVEVGPFPFLRWDKFSDPSLKETDSLNSPAGTELPQFSVCLFRAYYGAWPIPNEYVHVLNPIRRIWKPVLPGDLHRLLPIDTTSAPPETIPCSRPAHSSRASRFS